MIIATAGHVDHGKTALVRALTGQDTDRLAEEKRRGMSIDLGFAYLPLEGGDTITFIDVPGHERFIRNMVAGVQGIDLALLVIAADDGAMPQTREHLAILELLGVPRLVVVLTKIDRLPVEQLGRVEDECRQLLESTLFREAPFFPVSSLKRKGLDALHARLVLEAQALKTRPTGQRCRMNVDRSFILHGLGLVTTGTVLSGSVRVGDEVTLLPHRRRARVRSLHADHGPAMRAQVGQRCALALHGVERGEVRRGDVVVTPGPAPHSRHLDVTLQPLPSMQDALLQRRQVDVHLGTAMLRAALARLPGGLFARLTFSEEVSAWHGDRMLLRDPGAGPLLGAATVEDSQPPERGRSRPARITFLERIAGLPAELAFDNLVVDGVPLDPDWFAGCWNLSDSEFDTISERHPLVSLRLGESRYVLHADTWKALCSRTEQTIADWHWSRPGAVGPRLPDLLAATNVQPRELLLRVVQTLIDAGRVVREGPHLRLPNYPMALSARDEKLWKKIAPLLKCAAGAPPTVSELAQTLALDVKATADLLGRCSRIGRICRVAPNRFLLRESLIRLMDIARHLHDESGRVGFTVSTFRERARLGRNLAVQVLEFLDHTGYTRRAGELRQVQHREEKRPRWDARTSNPERGA